MGDKVEIPDELAKYPDHFLEMYPLVDNLIDHELNIDSFVELGFKKSSFIDLAPVPNYEARAAAEASRAQGPIHPEVGFSWWCMEYFRHSISTRHGQGKESELYAQCVLDWGSRVEPQLIATAESLRNWVEAGRFKAVANHPDEMNVLFDLMKLPRKTRWLMLRSSETKGRPSVTVL